MLRVNRPFVTAALAVALTAFAAGGALAQGKIVCWKDKAGKVVGCGDRVPPEFQDNATKELDKRGVTRAETETTEERNKRLAQEKDAAVQKADEAKRLAEQKRQDTALLNTFTNEQEIDLKRDRDMQVVDGQLNQLRVALKSALERHAEIKGRIDATTKGGKPATETQKEDLARAEADRNKAELGIVVREKEKADIRTRYGEMKQRYIKLKSGGTAAPTTAAAPAKK